MKTYHVQKMVNSDGLYQHRTIAIHDSRIHSIEQSVEPEGADERFYYAIPGFIDIHTHGGAQVDVIDQSTEALSTLAQHHLRNGTTSFIATSFCAPLQTLDAVLATVRNFQAENTLAAAKGTQAKLLGAHLEGPWLSRENKGAQNADHIISPDTKGSRELVEKHADILQMVTIGTYPREVEDFVHFLRKNDFVVACGHDQIPDERILQGFKHGIDHVTHIYSSTSSFQRVNGYKHLGTTEMALMTPGITVEVVADNRHITRYFWDFICHNKNIDDIMIVTDSIRCAGMPEKPGVTYKFGDTEVLVDDGVAWRPDKSMFAGSVMTMYRMFKILVQEWGVDMCSAVQMTSRNQALKFGLKDYSGTIETGKNADVLFLDKNLNIRKILKNGCEFFTDTPFCDFV